MSDHNQLDLIFGSLSDQTRRDIISRLIDGKLPISEIAEAYKMSLPAVSKHLSILEKSGLIEIERAGRQKFARLQFEMINMAQIWLSLLNDDAVIWDELERKLEAIENSTIGID